ncbi:OB-fold protein [Winogradskyella jejuensis]|uniref:tRNA_anti-like n=1 Tax=Winogradskyella jejuensis TaxID=1089305 RepID=A0A1M5ME67_9FLAO|nr:hypothetical protein [Winogradskyella jejuensis]SHG75462.1 tRNA_anti-like [Winogradskyella jejuensis]
MQLIFKKFKIRYKPAKILAILFLFLLIGITSCTENSDKIVSESSDVKQFAVDQINDESFNFENSNLIESVVLVKGEIKDINYLNERSTIILKGRSNDRLVICDMQDNQKQILQKLSIGDAIDVKGILKGSLNDIILLNCIIPQPKNNE